MSESREVELHSIGGSVVKVDEHNNKEDETIHKSGDGDNGDRMGERGGIWFRPLFPRVPWTEVVEEVFRLGQITCPVALTTLLYFSKTIISMLFLGHMEKPELAGGSLAVGFANVTGFSVMKGLCSGMDPICCQAFGARRWPILTQTYLKTVLLLLFATVPMALLWLNVDPVFHHLGQDRTISNIARNYLLCSLPELVTHACLIPLRTFLRTQGLNKPNTIVAACVSTLHLPITYFLVSYLNLRVKGIALASVIYSVNMNIGLWIYLFFSKAAIKPWPGTNLGSVVHGWGPLLGLALPSVLQACLEWWWYEIVLFLSGLLDDPDSCVAAMGLLIQTTGTVYIFPFAVGLSVSQRVGYELGAAQPVRAHLAAAVGFAVALGYGVVAFGMSVALKSAWGRLYTAEPEVLDLIASVMPIVGLAEIGNSPQTAACGALTGSARPKVGVWINIAAFYLVGLPCSVVFAFKMGKGFRGLWMGLVAAQVVCVSMMIWSLSRTDWKYEAKRAEELTEAVGEKEESAGTNLVA